MGVAVGGGVAVGCGVAVGGNGVDVGTGVAVAAVVGRGVAAAVGGGATVGREIVAGGGGSVAVGTWGGVKIGIVAGASRLPDSVQATSVKRRVIATRYGAISFKAWPPCCWGHGLWLVRLA